jgi:hypothetical protein
MRCFWRGIVLMIAGTLALPASAQMSPAAKPPAAPRAPAAKLPVEKPYKAVPVKLAPAADDQSFAAFRQQLAAVAESRVFKELAPLIVARGFFWHGDFSGGFNPRRSAMENFAAAIRLESEGGSGWSRLAGFAALASAAPLPSRSGVVCAPAPAEYDLIDFDQLTAATGTTAAAWRYPNEDGVALRAAPRPESGPLAALGLYLVRLLEDDPAAAIGAADWLRVAAPSGKTGYVGAADLIPLRSDRLCYQKDVTGRWRIAGYIAAGD